MSPPRNASNDAKFNLNTVLLLISIIGGFGSLARYVAPLDTLPQDFKQVRLDVTEIQKVQISQGQVQAAHAESINTIAEVVKENQVLRRDFDKAVAETNAALKRHEDSISDVKKKVERVESIAR